MESNTIKVPINVDEMRIRHLPFLTMLNNLDGEAKIEDIVEMNSKFTGIPIGKMRRYTPKDNITLYNQILKSFNSYIQKPIPTDLTIKSDDGEVIKYNFVTDFTKLPVDWFVDMSEADFENNPIDIMAFCFIEDGLSYGEPDEFENVINPRSKRNEVFRSHVPLSLFLDVQGFFLLNWNVFLKLQIERKKEETRKAKLKK
jgi:hypothetical protein